MKKIISTTESICPVCLRRIAAQRVAETDGIYMEKTCPEHGDFRVLLWRGSEQTYRNWERQKQQPAEHYCHTHVEKGCPYDCGFCEDHLQQICCVLLEVTQRCNLHCPVCFASAGGPSVDPTLEAIGRWYDELMKAGGPFNIQLSGGEPTMRNDLADIIRLGKEKGFTYFQLNTNGLRIAEEYDYLQELVQAGLRNVFLQFDGLTEHPYEVLRGKPLLEKKKAAIENCRKAKVGLTLVPTVAPGVNDNQVGDILNFALEHMPVVRGVHFQPVSYFGRCDLEQNEQRITIPDMLHYMETQTGGIMKASDFLGGGAENSYCSFHGNFMRMPDGTIKSIKSDTTGCCCTSSKQSREFVAKRWSAAPVLTTAQESSCCCGTAESAVRESSCCNGTACAESQENTCCSSTPQPSLFDVFLERMENYTLAVSGMLFQDAWNFDLERVKSCYLCEFSPQMKIVPFCAYNLSSISGETLYRGK
ncbi:MAG: radical SAM protein [Peptococcaceae bacterium]|nr:radical SAM protein [Peptococcaceae bacterium]